MKLKLMMRNCTDEGVDQRRGVWPCLPNQRSPAQYSSAHLPLGIWGRMGSSLDGSCISWSARMSSWRGSSLWDRKQNEFPVVGHEGSACWWNPPGDVEEREADAVFDEDGEVVHIQHWLAGKDNRRRRLRRTSRGLQDVCAHILHMLIVLLRWTPSSDLTPAGGVVDVVFRREADSRDCTCAMYEQGGVTYI